MKLPALTTPLAEREKFRDEVEAAAEELEGFVERRGRAVGGTAMVIACALMAKENGMTRLAFEADVQQLVAYVWEDDPAPC